MQTQDQNGEADGESKHELLNLAAEQVQLLLNLELQVYNSDSGLHSLVRSLIPENSFPKTKYTITTLEATNV